MRYIGEKIPSAFLQYAADILGDTNSGLSGPKLMKALNEYAVAHDVQLAVPTLEGVGINNADSTFQKSRIVFSTSAVCDP